ncbi:GGDEF domain-containing protein [Pseudomonas monteilii]
MDLITLHVTDALVNLTCGAMCFSIWASRPRDRCFAFWGLGSLLYGVTASWLPYLPDGVLGLGLGHSALQVGNIMFWAGYRAFDRVSALPVWLLALPSLPFLACLVADVLTQSEVWTYRITLIAYCGLSMSQVAYVLRGCESWYGPRAISAYAVILILASILITSFLSGTFITYETGGILFILTDHMMSIVFTLAVIAMVGQRDLQHLVNTSRRDPLTGALNRAGLAAVIAEDLPGTGLLLLDVDHFKVINDRHGHDAGDEVLRTLVARTSAVMRTTDHLIRMGGEEFLVIAPVANAGQAAELAEQILAAARDKPVHHGDAVIPFTLSIGFALRTGAEPFMQTFKRADLAMYHAKQSGRDRVVEGAAFCVERV